MRKFLTFLTLLLATTVFGDQFTAGGGNARKLQSRTVASTAPSDGNCLMWVAANSDWEPGTCAGASGATISGTPANHQLGVWTSATAIKGITAGTTNTVMHGNTGADPSFSGVDILNDTLANQGTTTTVLHGNAAGQPSYAGISLANDTTANQGTTTTVLHGNGAGQPSFGAIVNGDISNATIDLTTKVTGVLPVANAGTGAATAVAHAIFANNSTSTAAPAFAIFNDVARNSWYCASANVTDTYVCGTTGSPTPVVAACTKGDTYYFFADVANTGAATFDPGCGAKSILKNTAGALATGDITANAIVRVEYDGTNMQLRDALGNNVSVSFPLSISVLNNITATPVIYEANSSNLIRSTGLTGAVSTATLCAASANNCNTAGQYHVHWTFYESGTACGTPGTGGVTFLLTWTDANGTAHTAVSLPMDDGSSLVATSGTFHFQTSLGAAWGSGDFNIDTNGTIIQYATGYTACSVGTGTYALSAVVTRLQ